MASQKGFDCISIPCFESSYYLSSLSCCLSYHPPPCLSVSLSLRPSLSPSLHPLSLSLPELCDGLVLLHVFSCEHVDHLLQILTLRFVLHERLVVTAVKLVSCQRYQGSRNNQCKVIPNIDKLRFLLRFWDGAIRSIRIYIT